MTIISVKAFLDLGTYELEKEGYEVPRPSKCPAGCDSVMWKHTGYERGAIDETRSLRIIFVQRFRCRSLFDFLVPYSRYTVQVIASYGEEYLKVETTYEELAWSGDEANAKPSKRSIWRWLERLAGCAEKLARAVQQEAVQSDVANAEVEPVNAICPNALPLTLKLPPLHWGASFYPIARDLLSTRQVTRL